MADRDKQDRTPAADTAFRRQVGIAVTGAFITRHGGLGSAIERDTNARMIWALTDAILAAENLPPLPAPAVEDFRGILPQRAQRRQRPAHPADEWAVQEGNRLVKGFATYEEAEDHARGRADAVIVQVSGPGSQAMLVAPEVA